MHHSCTTPLGAVRFDGIPTRGTVLGSRFVHASMRFIPGVTSRFPTADERFATRTIAGSPALSQVERPERRRPS